MRPVLVVGLVCWLAAVAVASAKPPARTGSYTLVEQARLVQPGDHSKQAVEASSTGDPFTWGAVDLAIPAGLTLAQLNVLATDYRPALGSCWGGSPRFEAWVTDGTGSWKVHFFIGPNSTFTGCPSGVWAGSGNIAAPSSLVDDSQLGGSTSDPYSNTQANWGTYAVTHVYLDVDGGWYANQAIDFDNTKVNTSQFTFEK
jgi:hypothetical protein